MIETTVCTFKISVPFAEWVEKFDKDEAPSRDKSGVKVLFRGVNKKDPSITIVIFQALEGVLEKFIDSNIEYFKDKGAIMTTIEPTVWSSY